MEIQHTNCEAVNASMIATQSHLDWIDQIPELPAEMIRPIEIVDEPLDIDSSLRFKKPTKIGNKEILVTPRLLRDFVDAINELPDEGPPFAIMIGAGGTVGMEETASGLESKYGCDYLTSRLMPQYREDYTIRGVDFFKTDSCNLDIDDVGDMEIGKYYIWRHMKTSLRRRFMGFETLHGTDSYSKSGAHSLVQAGDKMPFNDVFTCAQDKATSKSSDGKFNIQDGLLMLDMLFRNGCAEGVSVMGGKARKLCGIEKVSDVLWEAMKSHLYPDIVDFRRAHLDIDTHILPESLRRAPQVTDANIDDFFPTIYRGPNRIMTRDAEMQIDPVETIIRIRLGTCKAILLISYGANTFPEEIFDIIDIEAKKLGIPIFITNPIHGDPKLGKYASSQSMIDAGVVELHMMSDMARAKLMRFLSEHPQEMDIVKAKMSEDFIGEIP